MHLAERESIVAFKNVVVIKKIEIVFIITIKISPELATVPFVRDRVIVTLAVTVVLEDFFTTLPRNFL